MFDMTAGAISLSPSAEIFSFPEGASNGFRQRPKAVGHGEAGRLQLTGNIALLQVPHQIEKPSEQAICPS